MANDEEISFAGLVEEEEVATDSAVAGLVEEEVIADSTAYHIRYEGMTKEELMAFALEIARGQDILVKHAVWHALLKLEGLA